MLDCSTRYSLNFLKFEFLKIALRMLRLRLLHFIFKVFLLRHTIKTLTKLSINLTIFMPLIMSQKFRATMSDLTILNTEDLPPEQELSTYFFDRAAAIRTKTKDCATISQLAWRLFNSVPSQYRTVVFVGDTYIQNSIKGGERRLRGDERLYVLKNTQMKLPSDMSSFLRNGQNKEMLFNLIEQSIYE